MKRKLALLLAGVMTLAALPMNIFAADTTGQVTTNVANASGYTVFYERSAFPNSVASSGSVTGNNERIEYYTVGPTLRFEWDYNSDYWVSKSLDNGNSLRNLFAMNLTGAEFWIRDANISNVTVDVPGTGMLQPLTATAVTATPVVGDSSMRANYPYTAFATALGTTFKLSVYDVDGLLQINGRENNLILAETLIDTTNGSGSNPATNNTILDVTRTGFATPTTTIFDDSGVNGFVPANKNGRAVTNALAFADFRNAFSVSDISASFTVTHKRGTDERTFNSITDFYESGISFQATDTVEVEFDVTRTGTPRIVLNRGNATRNFYGIGLPANATANSDSDGLTVDTDTNSPLGVVNTQNGFVINERLYFGYGVTTSSTTNNDTPYTISTSSHDAEVASVHVFTDGQGKIGSGAIAQDTLEVILPIRSKSNNDNVRVAISNTPSDLNINSTPHIVATAGAARTDTYVQSLPSGRDEFVIGNLMIAEKRAGSLRAGTFEIIAPTNYRWQFRHTDDSSTTVGSGIWIETGSNLAWSSGGGGANGTSGKNLHGKFARTSSTVRPDGYLEGEVASVGDSRGGADASANDYYMRYKVTSSGRRVDESVWVVTLHNVKLSTDTLGKIAIRGLVLEAEDQDRTIKSGKIQARIRTQSGSQEVVNDQYFDIAEVADYTLVLSRRSDKIPELISGRLESVTYRANNNVSAQGNNSNWGESDRIEDEYHKAAQIRVEETLADSWWGTKETQLVLPDGVKFLKVEFDNPKWITNSDSTLMKNTAYYNTHRKENGFITIDENKLTLNNLTLTATEKSRFDADIWLNIEVDYEGDIELTLTGYSVRYGSADEQAVVIATAIPPVEVETSVTDVKIGYQYTPVADFEITETRAGNLLRSEVVFISVTDEIYTDMAIATGFSAEVTDGDLRISNVKTTSSLGTSNAVGLNSAATGAHVRFTVDRPSTDASTIAFSNVLVKIDRTVAYSNYNLEDERGINVVVWGPGIAKNYEGIAEVPDGALNSTLYGTNAYSYDYFSTPGIRAKYINVATSPDGVTTAFTNVVSVTIGSPIAIVNDEEVTMPVAPYVSTASNSTMIPIRFVAYALGLAEDAVIWDPVEATVTVNGGTKVVQFQIGNTNYNSGGVSIPMTSPDGLPVAAEISEERAFVPYRALGVAFGMSVDWDPTTSTATYNAPTV